MSMQPQDPPLLVRWLKVQSNHPFPKGAMDQKYWMLLTSQKQTGGQKNTLANTKLKQLRSNIK